MIILLKKDNGLTQKRKTINRDRGLARINL